MSRWTVLRLLSIAILGLWLASPVLAQRPNPWRVASSEAPMPRAKEKHGELRLGIRFGGPQAVQMIYELRIDGEPAPAPMPRTAGSCPACAGVELVQVNGPGHLQLHHDAIPAMPVQQACPNHGRAGGDVLFEQRVIPTGPMLLGMNPAQSLPPCCDAHHCAPVALAQPHPLMIHRLPSCNEMTYSWTLHAPAAGVPQTASCCEANGWWLDTVPLPQPRHGIPVVVFPPVWDHGPVMMAESGGVQLDLRSFCAPATHGCSLSSAASPVAHCQATASMACCTSAGKLSGTWYREANGMVITVTLAGDEMKICTTLSDDTHTACVTLTADYAITKEGIVHGIVTGADVSGKSLGNGDGSPGDGPLEASAEYQKLVDCPFSFRAKMTSAGVMISNFKMAAADLDKDDLAMACGLYKLAVDGKVPTPRPFSTGVLYKNSCNGPVGVAPTVACQPPVAVEVVTRTIPDAVRIMPAPTPPGAVVPTNGEKERIKQYYGGGSHPVGSVELCPQCPNSKPLPLSQSFSPPRPANVPVSDFGMMADVFGQMVCSPAAQPCPVQPATLTTVVSRPMPTPLMPVPVARPIKGTWVREVGPVQYVLTIAGDHLSISVIAAAEFGKGQVLTQGMVLTADYQLLRDGATLVGVVTGVDAILEGDLSAVNDDPMPAEVLDQIQKMLSDKPLAMSLRVYGDTLMVGNVRLTDGPLAGGGFPLTALGGRYKNVGEKGIPKPKAMKVNDHPLCPPVAQAMPSPYPAVSGPVPTGAYYPAPFVGGILSTEYSTYPYPIGNPPVNPYGPPGAAIGLPPQPMQYPPPPVEAPKANPGKKKPMRSAPAPVGTR